MRFIESILLKDGVYHNLDLHQERVNRVFENYAPGQQSHHLEKILPKLSIDGDYKVRLVYDMDSEDGSYDLEYAAYHLRKIETLEVVQSRPFDYSHKYEDRKSINRLVEKSEADDIIIAVDNYITDGSYFNICLFDGVHWHTPDTPLLQGVRRSRLLRDKRIHERPIRIQDLPSFKKISFINAMLDLGDLELPTEAILLPKTGA